jgi:hypothetical protein
VKALCREHQTSGICGKSDESRKVLNDLDPQNKTAGLVFRQECTIMCYFVSLWALDIFVAGRANEATPAASVSSAFLMAKLPIVKFSFGNWQINKNRVSRDKTAKPKK